MTYELTVRIGDEESSVSVPLEEDDHGLIGLDESAADRPSADDCWIPADTSVTVKGHEVRGGRIFVGSKLASADSAYLVEPSLVDPLLPLTSRKPGGEDQHYWPSYNGLSAGRRSNYLDWLDGPRLAAGTPQTFLFIYFYGFERRILADTSGQAVAERPDLVAELAHMRGEIKDDDNDRLAFATYVDQLLDFLETREAFRGSHDGALPNEISGWQVPMTLRLVIGELAAAKIPLPSEVALSWMLSSPEAYLRTAAKRCRGEFSELFEIRYRERFGPGLKLPGGGNLRITYRPGSQGLHEISETTDLPDIAGSAKLIEPLRQLGRDCCDDLDAFSRRLGKDPGSRGSLETFALLPAPLLAIAESEELDDLRNMVKVQADGERPWVLAAKDLIEHWVSTGTQKLSKKEGVAVAQLLEGLGYGMEPDVRFGGNPLRADEQVVLFPAQEADPRAPSPAFASAILLLDLVAAVAAADGTIAPEERRHLESHVAAIADLYPGEQERLRAHVEAMTRQTQTFAGMKKKIEPLEPEQREAIGDTLAAIAAADGEVSPDEVKVLGKIFDLLELGDDAVYRRVHQVTSTGATGPVVVRPGKTEAIDFAIPAPERARRTVLDRDALDRKIEETAVVSSLLSEVFAEGDEDVQSEMTRGSEALGRPSQVGLDSAHADFGSALAARSIWSRAEVEALAADAGLMVDGALEAVNNAAFDACDAPLTEGEDPIEVDQEIAKEMEL